MFNLVIGFGIASLFHCTYHIFQMQRLLRGMRKVQQYHNCPRLASGIKEVGKTYTTLLWRTLLLTMFLIFLTVLFLTEQPLW